MGGVDFISDNLHRKFDSKTLALNETWDISVPSRPKVIVIVTSRTDMSGESWTILWSDSNENSVRALGYLNGNPTTSAPATSAWIPQITNSNVRIVNPRAASNVYVAIYY